MYQKLLALLAILWIGASSIAQVQRPVYLSQAVASGTVKGFYEYLPAGYNGTTQNYPIIIWIHGSGSGGQGNAAELPRVLEFGLPKNLSQGGFPASFNSGGTDYSFIILSPQFIYGWPTGSMITGMINYAVSKYRVDPDRIYLMGMSAGGGGVWDCASMNLANSNRLAAIVPFCGALAPTQAKANIIAAGKLPVWTFHNTNDGTVPVQQSRNWVNYINAYTPAINPAARLTEFPIVSNNAVIAHDSWSTVLVPTYKPFGLNIYEWLLQYKRRIVTTNASPQANAGSDQGIVLPSNVVLNGSLSSDPDGMIVSYRWKKSSGPSSHTFSDSTVIQPTVSNLTVGTYQFDLTVTDNQGASTTDAVIVNVYAALPPGAQQRVLIDIGADQTRGGVITSSPNINGNVWNNMTSALPGIRVSNAVSTTNAVTAIGLEVINRVDGTFNTGQPAIGGGNNSVVVGDYPGSATTDHALVHSSATNGRWRIFGLDPSKVYAIKFWGARTNTTATRSIEIKRSDDNVWLTYNATGNTNYNNAAVFNISGKTEMIFDIRTRAGSDFSCINVLDISYNGSGNPPPPPAPPANSAPIARAGADKTINLPSNTVTLDGCLSTDTENAPLMFRWYKVSGPQSTLASDTQCSTGVSDLIAGTYIFELVVTDTGNLESRDQVQVTVSDNSINNNWPPLVTPLCNQPYKIVVIGSSSAYGTGANPIDSSWVNKFRMYVQQQNPQVTVTNIATPGLTSYQVLETGFVPPATRPVPDTERNITKALSLNPDAIIINLPSNDIAMGYSLQECRDNFNRLAAACDAQNIPVWVTTTQARNGLSPNEKAMQVTLRDWINTRFESKAVDFWTTVGLDNGSMNPPYAAPDSVHVNNYGHHVLFTRMVEEKIWDSICIRRNFPPVANAGNDQTIQVPVMQASLDGSASSDPNGTIVSYQWAVINGPSGAQISNPQSQTTTISFSNTGSYIIRLTVTDNSGLTSTDNKTVIVQSASSTSQSVKVNIFGGVNPYNNPQWNNWNVAGSLTSSNLKFDDGSTSSIKASFNSQGGIADNGANYGAAATNFPPEVLRYNSFTTSIRTLTISGLNPSKTYYLEFYASRANSGNKSVIQINNLADTINTDNNVSDFAKFNNVVPASDGSLTINLSRIGTYQYLGGFIINEINTTGRGNAGQVYNEPPVVIQNPNSALKQGISIFPNPFAEQVRVSLNEKGNETYLLQISDLSGKIIFKKSITSKTGISENINTAYFQKGFYFLQVTTNQCKGVYKLIKQ